MGWPHTRIRTYSPNLPVVPGDLNRLQDAVRYKTHGVVYKPYPIDRRIAVTGTWNVSTSTATGIGSISDTGPSSKCVMNIEPPEAGARIVEVLFKVKDGGAGSLLFFQLFRHEDDGVGLETVGSVTSPGSGLVTTLPLTLAQSEWEAERVGISRWHLEITTTGGGSAARRVFGMEIGYYRP